MQRGAVELGQRPLAFTPAILEVAQEYNWPGNLRELRNFVTRTLILGDQESAINELRNKTRSTAMSAVLWRLPSRLHLHQLCRRHCPFPA